jgi:hypothetical protein
MERRGPPHAPTHATIKATARQKFIDEFKEFVVVAVYLCVSFTALAYLKFAILQAHGIAFAPFGFAAIKALICAKFVLVGRALHLGERYKTQALIWPTLHKSFAFLALLLVLNLAEEVIVGLMHGRSVTDSIADIGGGTLDQIVATSIVLFLILVPFFAFRSLGEVVGERNLVRVFLQPRHSADAA